MIDDTGMIEDTRMIEDTGMIENTGINGITMNADINNINNNIESNNSDTMSVRSDSVNSNSSSSSSSVDAVNIIDENDDNKNSNNSFGTNDVFINFIESISKYKIIKKELKNTYTNYISLYGPFRTNIFNLDLLLDILDDIKNYEFQTDIEIIKIYFDKINFQKNKENKNIDRYMTKFMKDFIISFKLFISLNSNINLFNRMIIDINNKETSMESRKYLLDTFILNYENYIFYSKMEFCEEKIHDKNVYTSIALLIYELIKKIICLDLPYNLLYPIDDFKSFISNPETSKKIIQEIVQYIYSL